MNFSRGEDEKVIQEVQHFLFLLRYLNLIFLR